MKKAEFISEFANLGVGLGLRTPHYSHVLNNLPKTAWFEAISENYMGLEDSNGGRPLRVLEKVRQDYPVVLHGVSLSIGSTDPLDLIYLKKLKDLAKKVEPAWISDHFCWTGVDGENLHDLLPLPYTEETLQHLTSRILQTQDVLGRRVLFENVSSYLNYSHSEMTEWEFLAEIAERADCAILLDVNNIYVSAINHAFDPDLYLNSIPIHRVGQMHLAGHSKRDGYLIDTHDGPVSEPVWELYRKAVQRFGPISTLIEWDAEIPDYSRLEAEAARAHQIQTEELKIEKGAHHGTTYAAASVATVDAMDSHRAERG